MMPLGESAWQTIFSQDSSLPVICVFTMIVLVVCIPTVANYWYRLAKARTEAELKHAMIERGMSAEEIERVLQAKSTREPVSKDRVS